MLQNGVNCTKFEVANTTVWDFDNSWKASTNLLLTDTDARQFYRLQVSKQFGI